MKKIGLVILAMFISTMAFASFRAYNNTTDLKIFDAIKCEKGVACSRSKDKLVVTVTQANVTSTTTTATAAQCGSTFVSDSADVITLPEASTVLGCEYTFVCGFAGNFDINPNDGTDQISTVASVTGTNTTTVLAPSAGDAIRCAAIGASVKLKAVGANLWISVGLANGIWTDVN